MTGYPPIELGQPGKPACPDSFTATSERECAGCGRLILQVSAAAVVIQFGTGIGAIEWGPEETYLPLAGSLARRFDAVRVRNYTAGQAAQVLLTPIPAGA